MIITGLSGSGKSTVLRALEDVGYFCVDNLPLHLLPPFLAMQDGASREGRRIALGMDVRTQGFLQSYERVFRRLEKQGFKLHLIFLEADEESLIRRFSQTRRQHPLADRESISQALREEITAMAGLRGLAHRIIDTSFYNVHQLRELIKDEYSDLAPSQRMLLHLISFAYKNGIPPEADMVIDVRFLPNPYFVDQPRLPHRRRSPGPGLCPGTARDPGLFGAPLQLRGLPVALLPGGRQDPPHPGSGLHRGPAPLGGHRQPPGRASDPGQFTLHPQPSRHAADLRRPLMIGILIVTHKELAEALISVWDLILGRGEGVQAVSLDPNDAPEVSRQKIQRALSQVNNGSGVIILTDMLGGTPSNQALPFLQEGKVEVITGVNLPMLMKLPQIRQQTDLREAAAALKQSGQKGITVASEVLHRKK